MGKKINDYMTGREDGLLMALDIVKKGGIEALEKEVRFRNVTGIRTALAKKDLDMLLKEYEDTGLTPEQIMELKERDTAKMCKQSIFDHDSITCVCGSDMDKEVEFMFCPWCGQRLKK